ncbi:hypothetical protein J2W17_000022 [Pseudomonas lini]|nr:hypothetical protein [Pseudomonas lini]
MLGLANKVESFGQPCAIRQLHFHRIERGIGLDMLLGKLGEIILLLCIAALFTARSICRSAVPPFVRQYPLITYRSKTTRNRSGQFQSTHRFWCGIA